MYKKRIFVILFMGFFLLIAVCVSFYIWINSFTRELQTVDNISSKIDPSFFTQFYSVMLLGVIIVFLVFTGVIISLAFLTSSKEKILFVCIFMMYPLSCQFVNHNI